MTTEEFKKLKPEYKDIEGDQLWNAMTNYMLQQQEAGEIIKSIKPIWKTHTLRWLYYRRMPNLVTGSPVTDKYTSDKRCEECKQGVNTRLIWLFTKENGDRSSHSNCPHCGKEYHPEPNTNLSHRSYKLGKWIVNLFWRILDKLHLVRSSLSSRYDMFGDEARYVQFWGLNTSTGKTSYTLKKRKWWEYILIERPTHNF